MDATQSLEEEIKRMKASEDDFASKPSKFVETMKRRKELVQKVKDF